MNQITIRNLDDTVVQRLRQLAWQEGVPLEESLRRLLVDATRAHYCERLREHYPAATD